MHLCWSSLESLFLTLLAVQLELDRRAELREQQRAERIKHQQKADDSAGQPRLHRQPSDASAASAPTDAPAKRSHVPHAHSTDSTSENDSGQFCLPLYMSVNSNSHRSRFGEPNLCPRASFAAKAGARSSRTSRTVTVL